MMSSWVFTMNGEIGRRCPSRFNCWKEPQRGSEFPMAARWLRTRMELLSRSAARSRSLCLRKGGCGVPCCSRTWRPVRRSETDPLYARVPVVQPLVCAAAGEARQTAGPCQQQSGARPGAHVGRPRNGDRQSDRLEIGNITTDSCGSIGFRTGFGCPAGDVLRRLILDIYGAMAFQYRADAIHVLL